MKELVIFDIDGTIIKGQSQMYFLNYLLSIRRITLFFYAKLLMWFILYKIGIVSDPKKPMTYAYSFLKGVSINDASSWIHDLFNKKIKEHIYVESINIVKDHQKHGRTVLLVSNTIQPIVREFARITNIEYFIATNLEIESNHYTGRIHDIVYGNHKVAVVNKFAHTHGFELRNAWAYGDHLSDAPLLSLVKHPVAVNPSRSLANLARKNNWQIQKFSQYK